jgi:anthranilate phosphoribosyltransferase
MPTVSQLEALLAGACSPEETLALLAHLKPHLATQALVTTLWQLLWQQRSPAYANLPALPHVLDTCGTGGSPLGSFNTSTCVAIVLASAGVAVVKFGNRSATGRSGSTDFLEAIGLPPEAMHQHWQRLLEEANLAFLAAPQVYPALAHLAPLRKQAGHPTLFNVLGPLLNPVQPGYRLMGHAFRVTLPLVAEVLATELPTQCAWVMRSDNGLDELSPHATAEGWWVTGEQCVAKAWQGSASLALPTGGEGPPLAEGQSVAQHNAQYWQAMVGAELAHGEAYAGVVLNAGAGLHVAGKAASVAEGVTLAQQLLSSGQVAAYLHRLRQLLA